METLAKFLRKIRRLSYLERCSNTLHIQRYPVAEHTFYTAFLTMLFADLENRRWLIEEGVVEYYNAEKALRKALIHDLEESITGDILYPIKNEDKEFSHVIKAIIGNIVDRELFEELPRHIREMYERLWHESKDESREGKLISAMDKLEILLYADSEISLGNHSLNIIHEKAKEILLRDFEDIITLQLFIKSMKLED